MTTTQVPAPLINILRYFQVIPVYLSAQWPNMDWMNYLTLWESLSPDTKRVGELIGVEERFLVRAMRGTVNPTQPAQVSVHANIYFTLNISFVDPMFRERRMLSSKVVYIDQVKLFHFSNKNPDHVT